MSQRNVASGTLTSTVPVKINLLSMVMPLTITLKSAAAGRLLRLSSDGGTEFYTPALDVTSATMQVLVVTAQVSHMEVTGQAGDTWNTR